MLVGRLRPIQVLLFAVLLLVASSSRLSAQYTLRIGVIDQPDGSMLAGARLAANHVNEAGGIIGADGTIFQLAVVDTLRDHMEIATANMRQANVIAVLGPETDQILAQNMLLLQALEIPIFTPATGDTALLSDRSNRIFRSRAPQSAQIGALADYLANTLKLTSIQTIQLDAASTANLITLANALSSFGVRPTNLRYEQGRLDLAQIAQSIAQSAPDARRHLWSATQEPRKLSIKFARRVSGAKWHTAAPTILTSPRTCLPPCCRASLARLLGHIPWMTQLAATLRCLMRMPSGDYPMP